MKKVNRRIVLILCLITVCGLSCKRNGHYRDKRSLESLYRTDSLECLKHIGTLITEDSVKITNSDGKEHYLTDLALNDKIIVRFSVFACKPCVDFIINGALNRNDIVVFMAKSPVYDLHVYEAEMNCKVFNVDRIKIDFDEGLTPFVFKIDGDGRVRDFFIPRKETPATYMEYLEKHRENTFK